MKISRIVYTLIVISFSLALHPACTVKTNGELPAPQGPATLAEATEVFNKRCPEIVDPETRMDSVKLSLDNIMTFYYTLPNMANSSIDPKAFSAYLMPGVIENIKSNPDLKMHRDSSVTMVFNYRDRNGEQITEFSVGPNSNP